MASLIPLTTLSSNQSLYLLLGILSSSTLYCYVSYMNKAITEGTVIATTNLKKKKTNKKKRKKKKKTVPYTNGIGIIKTLQEFIGPNAPYFMLQSSRAAAKQYNGMNAFRLNVPLPGGMYVVNDYKLAKQILCHPTTDKSALVKTFMSQATGMAESILSSNNNVHWKMMRKLTSSAFATTEITRMKTIAVKYTNELCNDKLLAAQDNNNNNTTLLQAQDIARLTVRIICQAAFEYTVSDNESHLFLLNVNMALRELLVTQPTNPIRQTIIGWLLYPDVRQSRQAIYWLRQFAQNIIDTYRTNTNKLISNNTIIKLIIECDEIKTDSQRVAEILVFIIGGFGMTASSISSLLVHLAKYPHTATKLHADTVTIQPSDWSQKSQYFNYCIKESHRLLPVVAVGITRIVYTEYPVTCHNSDDDDTDTDTTTDIEYIIPKGATVCLPLVTIGRDETIFTANDVDIFNPDRWYNSTEQMNDCIIPFGMGNRSCVAQALGSAEINTIVPIIVSNFDITLDDEGQLEHLLTWKINNYKLILKPRHPCA